MKKKAFTFVEMLIVVLIIGILMVAFKSFFQTQDRDFLAAQTCYNNVYGDIRSYFDSAITAKGLYTGNNVFIQPDKYIIDFDRNNYKVNFRYDVGGAVSNYKTLNLNSTDFSGNNFCYQVGSFVSITGSLSTGSSISSISVRSGMIGDINNPAFVMTGFSGGNWNQLVYTGNLFFTRCTRDSKCKDIGKLSIDKRVNKITQNRCLLWNKPDANGNQSCKNRNIPESSN